MCFIRRNTRFGKSGASPRQRFETSTETPKWSESGSTGAGVSGQRVVEFSVQPADSETQIWSMHA